MSTVTIASIYFMPVFAERSLFRDANQWYIPAVPRELPDGADKSLPHLAQPALLVVRDGYQQEQEPITRVERKTLITAEEIAYDIVREWTTNAPGMTPECKPGIWVCAGSKPTEEERQRAVKWQSAWCEYLIMQGDEKMAKPEERKYITPLMRAACRWMGRERDWLLELKDAEIKMCPFCKKAVPADAIKCQFCGEIIDVARYAKLVAERDAIVKAAAAPTAPLPPPVHNPQQARPQAR